MKPFHEMVVNILPITRIKDYFAHSNIKSGGFETLSEHIEQTRLRFLSLCRDGLESIIDRQIADIFIDDHDVVKQMILDIICLHDLGKLNPAFQNKIRNPHMPCKFDADSGHSEIGWVLFSLGFSEKINALKNDRDFCCTWILTTAIAGHHTFAWGVVPEEKLPTRATIQRALDVAKNAGWELKGEPKTIWEDFDRRVKDAGGFPPCLFVLYKTLYSSLILADSTATAESTTGKASELLAVTENDIARWCRKFSATPHMKWYEKVKPGLGRLQPEDITDSLNLLRCKILHETERNLNACMSENPQTRKRLFYLEAPTGSGKTNCAINLALRILEADGSIKHAVFVFPFVNLIEQNVDVLKTAIGAEPGDVLEVHSLAEWGQDDEGVQDYAKELDQRSFLNAKISVISSVNFLESLGSSRKSANYKVCNLSNSVVVLDEIQSIDDTKWPYLAFLLDIFARYNNCYFILMSATLPKVDKIRLTEEAENGGFVELLPDSTERYQKHPIFKNRTLIKLRMDINTTEELCSLVSDLLKNAKPPVKLLVVVNTIKRSREVFSLLPGAFETAVGVAHFHKYLLNSELLPHVKRNVIYKARSEGDNIIVVSTQCIEAGVDADFDIGIRDYAIPDSIEQVAGRVNREGKRLCGSLYVVDLKKSDREDAEKIYGRGRRWATLHRMGATIFDVFDSRDLTPYYDALTEYITKLCIESGKAVGIEGRSEVNAALNLRLSELRHFYVIENDVKISYFIPTRIPITEFKTRAEQIAVAGATDGDVVDGRCVWNEYQKIKSLSGRDGFLKMAAFSPILARFIANKTPLGKERPLKSLNLLDNWQEVYNPEIGFTDSEGIF